MPKRLSKTDFSQNALRVAEIATGEPLVLSSNTERRRIMAEMGSLGGRIGGKRRAERMTPEARRMSASMAARARWNKGPLAVSQDEKRQRAAEKIAAILEQAMTDMGLTEDQKDAKTAEMATIAMTAVMAKT
jgi:hypothetical protein